MSNIPFPTAGATPAEWRAIYQCIDHTSLNGDDTPDRIATFCREVLRMQDAATGHVASVCVYPVCVPAACKILEGSGIQVVSVAGAFPSGQSPLKAKLEEVRYALDAGADEIDTVLPRGAFLSGAVQQVRDEISAMKDLCGTKVLKVILETCELPTEDTLRQASRVAMEAGADFIKTSTGKGRQGATPQAAAIMLQEIVAYRAISQKQIGFKAAGGIAVPEDALQYYRLAKTLLGEKVVNNHTFRIGTSRLTPTLFRFLTQPESEN